METQLNAEIEQEEEAFKKLFAFPLTNEFIYVRDIFITQFAAL